MPPDCICMKSMLLALVIDGEFQPPPHNPRPRFLSDVFPLGGTKYACESKVVTPSNTTPVSVISSFNSGVSPI